MGIHGTLLWRWTAASWKTASPDQYLQHTWLTHTHTHIRALTLWCTSCIYIYISLHMMHFITQYSSMKLFNIININIQHYSILFLHTTKNILITMKISNMGQNDPYVLWMEPLTCFPICNEEHILWCNTPLEVTVHLFTRLPCHNCVTHGRVLACYSVHVYEYGRKCWIDINSSSLKQKLWRQDDVFRFILKQHIRNKNLSVSLNL